MEENQLCREELLIGEEGIEKLKKAKILIYGIGGVGSFVCEGLARAGIRHFVLVDPDVISLSNCNRQLHATIATIGRAKTEVMKERILLIQPEAIVEIEDGKEKEEDWIDSSCSYVIDAVDTITTKIVLAQKAQEEKVRMISSMGTGNKMDPTRFEVTDIYQTSVCPLAKVMRKELKKRGVQELKVVYSKEEPMDQDERAVQKYQKEGRRKIPGSISFVPSVAGLIIAGEVIKDLLRES